VAELRGVAKLMGLVSILGHWGDDKRQRGSTIRGVRGLLGWVRRVLRQVHLGLGLWQRCGGQISILGR